MSAPKVRPETSEGEQCPCGWTRLGTSSNHPSSLACDGPTIAVTFSQACHSWSQTVFTLCLDLLLGNITTTSSFALCFCVFFFFEGKGSHEFVPQSQLNGMTLWPQHNCVWIGQLAMAQIQIHKSIDLKRMHSSQCR